MGLLALSKDKIESIDRYKELLKDDKWDWLIDKFIKESYHLHSLTTNPLLIKCLNIGVTILKTIFCNDDEFFNENCPTCSKSFRSFGENLPYIEKGHTSLICRISGEIMDENNPPMMLPNYHIYSEKALRQQAVENDGYVICAKTKVKCKFEKCRKVYIS